MSVSRRSWLTLSLDFVAALSLAVLWGSIAQTQFNLAALTSLGAEIGTGTRLATTGQDLLGFGPLYAAVVGVILLVALPIAAALTRLMPRFRLLWFTVSAGVGWLVALRLIDALVPMPTLIAATRDWPGLVVMAIGVALAGALFAMLTRRSEPSAEAAATSPPSPATLHD